MPAVDTSNNTVRPAARRRRTQLHAFLETRGVLGGHGAPHVTTRLRSRDGTLLAGTYLPGPGPDAPAVLLMHGFAAHRRKPAYATLADVLSEHAHVLSLDLRGHGQSGGASTLGAREAMDAAAGIRWLRAHGHDWVAMVGLSMGGTTALHAASLDAGADAVVAISAPARLEDPPTTEPMRRLHTVWRSRVLRTGMRLLLKVRVVPPVRWEPPPHPQDAARSIRAPLLVVHGEDDAYFPPSDARDIAEAAGGPAAVWDEPAGFGHAEDGVTTEFVHALGLAIVHAQHRGRFPTRDLVRVRT